MCIQSARAYHKQNFFRGLTQAKENCFDRGVRPHQEFVPFSFLNNSVCPKAFRSVYKYFETRILCNTKFTTRLSEASYKIRYVYKQGKTTRSLSLKSFNTGNIFVEAVLSTRYCHLKKKMQHIPSICKRTPLFHKQYTLSVKLHRLHRDFNSRLLQ